MKIVVIGGTGLVGAKTAAVLRRAGHEVVAASRKNGVDAVMGKGLIEALAGAAVVIDASNAPSSDRQAVMKFFETSTKNILAAEVGAGVRHHVLLIHRRRGPGAWTELLPRQGCAEEAHRDFRDSVRDPSGDPIHGIPCYYRGCAYGRGRRPGAGGLTSANSG